MATRPTARLQTVPALCPVPEGFWGTRIPAAVIGDTAEFRNLHDHAPADRLKTLDLPFFTEMARWTAAATALLAGRDRP